MSTLTAEANQITAEKGPTLKRSALIFGFLAALLSVGINFAMQRDFMVIAWRAAAVMLVVSMVSLIAFRAISRVLIRYIHQRSQAVMMTDEQSQDKSET